jgi:peptidylglycine monooxygenase
LETETLYVALGAVRYRVDRFWGRFPEGDPHGLVSTVAVARDGSVLVARRNAPAVAVLGADGTWHGTWGDRGVADPHGITVDAANRVLLVDRDAHQVLVRGVGGEPIAELGERHHPRDQAPFNHPTSAAAAPDGEIYVADGYGNSLVHRFAADGTHLATWGEPGRGPGQFSTPHAVRVDSRDRVLVVDRENDRVQVFDRDGRYLQSWDGFNRPMDLCEGQDGFYYVTDQTPRLSRVDADGGLRGRCRPVWNVPHGIAAGPGGVFYLTEMNPSSLTRLVPVPH